LPEPEKEKSEEGKVIAVGARKKIEDGKIISSFSKTGDKFYFTKYGRTK